MSTIKEHKKEILMGLINRLGSEIGIIYHTIEEDTNIPPNDYEAYEKQIESLYSILQDLEEEVIFS
jgi:hypothetical protein